METDRNLSLFTKERRGCARFLLGEVHAWHQPALFAVIFIRHPHNHCKIDAEKISYLNNNVCIFSAAFVEAFPPGTKS